MDKTELEFRRAKRADVVSIVAMLVDDHLGQSREQYENPLPNFYYDAFAAIDADPNQELWIAEQAGHIVGTFQLTLIPCIGRKGSWRAMVESVRVAAALRGQGIGKAMMAHAIARARARGCRLLQLTTDKRRPDAFRFYQQLGFEASHEGMKLNL
ncbi:MAG: GNAT family N-acetyltransferase [Acidobacteria bacterium]|nr:GNAT family N-acetyltransferase [Acidobacteriota bacterium]